MKRVLCLGAYANGNLGDMYQADAIGALVAEVCPDAEVTSVSPSKRGSGYPSTRHHKGPLGEVSPDFINRFDALLVGGGGLLSAPHAPLGDADWAEAIMVPIFAISVGAAGDNPERCRAFVMRCERFSVRDEFSLEAVSSLRPDAEIVMDPILLSEAVEPPIGGGAGKGVVWVPGKIVEGTRPWWSDVRDRLMEPQDAVLSFNPVTDRGSGFDTMFPRATYLETIEPFLVAAASARFLASERYHACIYALARGRPTLGLATRSRVVTSKIEELYRRIGHPDAVVRDMSKHTRQTLRALADAIDLTQVRTYLTAERERLKTFLAECLA